MKLVKDTINLLKEDLSYKAMIVCAIYMPISLALLVIIEYYIDKRYGIIYTIEKARDNHLFYLLFFILMGLFIFFYNFIKILIKDKRV